VKLSAEIYGKQEKDTEVQKSGGQKESEKVKRWKSETQCRNLWQAGKRYRSPEVKRSRC